jgi:hypothetical protein
MVRVPLNDFAMVSRALDFGAEAIIAPMINALQTPSSRERCEISAAWGTQLGPATRDGSAKPTHGAC